jgi:uncharacterized protein with FMN-binding domain
MKRAALTTVSTVTVIVVLLSSKSATRKSARPPLVAPLLASEPPVAPATSPSAAGSSIASGPSTAETVSPTLTATPTRAPTNAPTQAPTNTPTRTTAPPTKPTSATFLGAAVQTRYGPVQIRITYAGGRVSGVVAVQLPSGRSRDAEINSYAVPILESETLAAQSANINSVSGATYTSDGYVQSLQSALDAAHR